MSLSADRFKDSELDEPLRQLQAKGVVVDLAVPQKGITTGKHGRQVEAGLASTKPADLTALMQAILNAFDLG